MLDIQHILDNPNDTYWQLCQYHHLQILRTIEKYYNGYESGLTHIPRILLHYNETCLKIYAPRKIRLINKPDVKTYLAQKLMFESDVVDGQYCYTTMYYRSRHECIWELFSNLNEACYVADKRNCYQSNYIMDDNNNVNDNLKSIKAILNCFINPIKDISCK